MQLPLKQILDWLAMNTSTYYHWKARYKMPNQHGGQVPKCHWITEAERLAIIEYHLGHQGQGYRRQTYIMLDADVVAVSPSTTYRVLKEADLMQKWALSPSKKGTGFNQPKRPHAHWHIDMAYVNIRSTFYYLCSILDGYSRAIIHWELREQMKEADVEIVLQRARELYPDVYPRIISDNGPQFISRDFKLFLRQAGMAHVRTSPYYPQSNGKKERYFKTLKSECIRAKTPLSLDEARRAIDQFVHHYNHERLHSAIGYVTPMDKLHGREPMIFKERNRKLEAARLNRSQECLKLAA